MRILCVDVNNWTMFDISDGITRFTKMKDVVSFCYIKKQFTNFVHLHPPSSILLATRRSYKLIDLSKKPEVSSFVCQEIEKGIKTLTKFTS